MPTESEPLDCYPAVIYNYYRGGRYKVVGIGRHVHTLQELVAYRGLDEPDKGLLFFCPLVDWQAKFTRIPAPEVPPKPVPKAEQKGSGF